MIRYYVSFSVPAVAYAALAAVSLAAAYAVLKGIYALTAKSGGTTTGRNPHGCALNAALRSDF
jgi:hypothetical protein